MSDLVFNVFYVLFSLFVSSLFWITDNNKSSVRFFNSIHSILLLMTLAGALFFSSTLHIYKNAFIISIFWVLLIVSLLSIFHSFFYFKGTKWVFILHFWNIFALTTTSFIGTMALSNDWL